MERLVCTPLSALQSMFPMPQKLIQKRYDKLLDYHSSLQKPADSQLDQAKKDYEALNAQLVEELQVFNKAARSILFNCLYFFITLVRDVMTAAMDSCSHAADSFPVSDNESFSVNPVILSIHNSHCHRFVDNLLSIGAVRYPGTSIFEEANLLASL